MNIKFTSAKTNFTILFILAVVFVTVGDRFLPGSLGAASQSTREGISKAFLQLMPKERFDNPHERTEKAVEELEQRGR